MSNIRVRKPDTIHSWGIEFNYDIRTDFDAPAGEFVAACNRYLHNKGLFPGVIWFHQCGADTAPNFTGYQFFECWPRRRRRRHLGRPHHRRPVRLRSRRMTRTKERRSFNYGEDDFYHD